MKRLYLILPFIIVSAIFAEKVEKRHRNLDHQPNCLDEANIDIENEVIILICKYDDEQWVEITPDYTLFINGLRINLDKYQQRLVADYYDHFMDILDQAKQIGKEGAIIGVKGAKIGLIAAAGALKMLVSDYDSDDIEDDIEDETLELEERAERLEEMAEDLEETADDFEDLHYTIKDEIKDLNDLDWF